MADLDRAMSQQHRAILPFPCRLPASFLEKAFSGLVAMSM
jgi:hypothetical protein